MAKESTTAGNSQTAFTLKPGDKVDLLVTQDFYRDLVDTRASVFWGDYGQGLLLAQTEPPLGPQDVGQTVQLTYLVPQAAGAPQRLGYAATILGLATGGLSPGQEMPGLVLSRPAGPLEEISLRRYHRVEVKPGMGIYLVLVPPAGHPVLHNFSVGGALVSLPGEPQYEHGQAVQVNMVFADGGRVLTEATVNRVAYDHESHRTYVGLKFGRMPVPSARVLQRKVTRYSCPPEPDGLPRQV